MLDELKKHFSPRPSEVVATFKFNSRIRHSGEMAGDFFASLNKLADNCAFGTFRDRMLRDRIVAGINDEAMQRRLLESPDLTLDTAKKTVIAMEAANKDSRALSTAMPMTVAPTNAVSRDTGKQKHKPVSCFRCGGEHLATQCRHASSVCHKCRSKGHLARVCKGKAVTVTSASGSAFLSRKHQSIHTVDDEESRSETPAAHVYEMWQVRAPDHDGSPYRVEVSVNGTSLIMELDTGASVSVVSEETFRRTFPSCRLEPSSVMLKGYTSGELAPVQVSLPATVRLGNHVCRDVLHVVPGRCPSLMGRGWMKDLGIALRNVMDVKAITSVEGHVAEYASVFDDTLGTFKGVSAKIKIEDNAKPRFFEARPELHTTPARSAQIERDTRQQARSSTWKKERSLRLTASNFGVALARKEWTAEGLQAIASSRDISHVPAVKYGISNEAVAAVRYEEVLKAMGHNVTVSTCDLLLNPAFPWLGASPYRIVYDPLELSYGVVEIKCPYSLRDTKGEELVGLSFCSELTDTGPKLSREHHYYSQLIGQMGVSELSWGNFVIFSKNFILIEREVTSSHVTVTRGKILGQTSGSPRLPATTLAGQARKIEQVAGGWLPQHHHHRHAIAAALAPCRRLLRLRSVNMAAAADEFVALLLPVAELQRAYYEIEEGSNDVEDHITSLLLARLMRQDRHRVPLYVERVVSTYMHMEFTKMFRLSRSSAGTLVEEFETSAFYPQGSRSYLIGDSADLLMPWLLPPYLQCGANWQPWMETFNAAHCRQRVVIEGALGLLKTRF
ncbi:hypothetical protein MTO96_023440 [Rhipicephalus appendiculatus]